MRKRWGKLTAVMAGLAVTAGLLTGCGSFAGGNTEKEISGESEIRTTGTGAGDDRGDVKEVTLWHYLKFEAGALEKAAESYNESQDKIHVTCTYMSRDEFYEVCKATADADNSVYGFSMSAIGNEEGTFQYIPWLYSAGGSVTGLNTPEAAESLDFLAGLVNEKLMSKEVINWGQDDALNAFIAGKAAMVESGTWQVGQIDSGDITLGFNYRYAMLPKNETYASVIGGENFGVCTGTESREECIDFLKFIMTAENNADWCEMAGKLPVRSDAMELRDIWTKDDRYAVFSEAMNYAVARGPHESWPTISEAIYTAEQAVLLGEKNGKEAMAAAASVINPILEEVPIAE